MASSMAAFQQHQSAKRSTMEPSSPIPIPTGMANLGGDVKNEDPWQARLKKNSEFYTQNIDGIDCEMTQPASVWLPHIPKWYFADTQTINNAGGTVAYIKPYKGAEYCPRVTLGDPTNPLYSFPGSYPVDKKKQVTTRDKLQMEVIVPEDTIEFAWGMALQEKFYASAYMYSKNWISNSRIKNMGDHIETNGKEVIKVPKKNEHGEYENPKAKPTMKIKVTVAIKEKKTDPKTKEVIEGERRTSGPGITTVYICKNPEEAAKGKDPILEEGDYKDLMAEKRGKIMRIVPIVNVKNVWFMGTEFGVLLEAETVIIFPKPARSSDLGFKCQIVKPSDSSLPPAPMQTDSQFSTRLPPPPPATFTNPMNGGNSMMAPGKGEFDEYLPVNIGNEGQEDEEIVT